jgi:hypothetical protein
MSIELTKSDIEMISAGDLDGPGVEALKAGVIARLTNLIESGVVDAISRNHVRAAVTAELAKDK